MRFLQAGEHWWAPDKQRPGQRHFQECGIKEATEPQVGLGEYRVQGVVGKREATRTRAISGIDSMQRKVNRKPSNIFFFLK